MEQAIKNIASLAEGKKKRLAPFVKVGFTLKHMEIIAREFAWQTVELADLLEGNNIRETCLNIWNFIRENVEWIHEKGEELRTPAALLASGKGDCDCMSILTSTILLNLGIKHSFRVVGHLPEKPDKYTHVFVVVPDGNKEIFIDCVPEIGSFNEKQIQFFKQYDYPMAETSVLYGLGGMAEIAAIKSALEGEFNELELVARQTDIGEEGRREMAILKTVIAFADDEEQFPTVLLNAAQNSTMNADLYHEIYQDVIDGGDGLGFLKKLRKKLDKLGETGIGKAFRRVRDKVIRPAIRTLPLGKTIDRAASKAGDAFNAVTHEKKRPTMPIVRHGLPQERPIVHTPQMRQTTALVPNSSVTREITNNDTPEEEPKGMAKVKLFVKKHKKWFIIAAIAIVVIVLGVWGWKKHKASKKKPVRKRRRRKSTNNLNGISKQQLMGLLAGQKPKRRRRRKTTTRRKRKVKARVITLKQPRRRRTRKRKTTTRRKRKAA